MAKSPRRSMFGLRCVLTMACSLLQRAAPVLSTPRQPSQQTTRKKTGSCRWRHPGKANMGAPPADPILIVSSSLSRHGLNEEDRGNRPLGGRLARPRATTPLTGSGRPARRPADSVPSRPPRTGSLAPTVLYGQAWSVHRGLRTVVGGGLGLPRRRASSYRVLSLVGVADPAAPLVEPVATVAGDSAQGLVVGPFPVDAGAWADEDPPVEAEGPRRVGPQAAAVLVQEAYVVDYVPEVEPDESCERARSLWPPRRRERQRGLAEGR